MIELVGVPRQVLEGCSERVKGIKKGHTISYRKVRGR